jgi:hypothetical protein
MFAFLNSLYFFPTSFSNDPRRWPNSRNHQERLEDHHVPEMWDWYSIYFPWLNIKELGERLKWRLHNTQQDLKEEKEDTTTLKETINQLQGDMEKLVSELSVQRDLIKTKDEQIINLLKQLDQNNGSA